MFDMIPVMKRVSSTTCHIFLLWTISRWMQLPFDCDAFVLDNNCRGWQRGGWTSTQMTMTSSSSSSSSAKNNNNNKDKGNNNVQDKNDDDETTNPLSSLLQELNQQFDYQGRMQANNMAANNDEFRCGFVVIIGAPNMGKSTLVNALLQEDLCIATARPQTTRHAILGLLSTDTTQVCLVDTPGVIDRPAYKLQQGMMEAVLGAFYDADVLLVVTDVYSTPIPSDALFGKVQQSNKPVVVVINKIDLLDQPPFVPNNDQNVNDNNNDDYGVPASFERTTTVEQAVAQWRRLLPRAVAIIPVAASQGPNQVGVQALHHVLTAHPHVDEAFRSLGRPIAGMFPDDNQYFLTRDDVAPLLPQSPPLYDTEILTDRPQRFIASEMIRAALFQSLRKEVPYCCEVRLQSFKEVSQEQPGDANEPVSLLRLEATIVVERDSQKAIVIGKGGSTVKEIRTQAQKALQDFFQTPVTLLLQVTVDKDWRKNEKRLQEYGYMQPKKRKQSSSAKK